jgi:hypothetical protein
MGDKTVTEGERTQGQHAHHLRGLIARQVESLVDRRSRIYHEASELKRMLELERAPMGFDKHQLSELVRKLTPLTALFGS